MKRYLVTVVSAVMTLSTGLTAQASDQITISSASISKIAGEEISLNVTTTLDLADQPLIIVVEDLDSNVSITSSAAGSNLLDIEDTLGLDQTGNDVVGFVKIPSWDNFVDNPSDIDDANTRKNPPSDGTFAVQRDTFSNVSLTLRSDVATEVNVYAWADTNGDSEISGIEYRSPDFTITWEDPSLYSDLSVSLIDSSDNSAVDDDFNVGIRDINDSYSNETIASGESALFENVPVGEVRVSVFPSQPLYGEYSRYRSKSFTIDLQEDDSIDVQVDLAESGPVDFQGAINHQSNRAMLNIHCNDSGDSYIYSTDESGEFLLEGLPEETCSIFGSANNHLNYVDQNVDLSSVSIPYDINLDEKGDVEISGTIVDSLDSETPVGGARINLSRVVGKQVDNAFALADSNGDLELKNLSLGEYEYQLNFYGSTLYKRTTGTIEIGPETTSAVFEIDRVSNGSGEISGIVLDSDGEPKPNHGLFLQGLNGLDYGVSASTDSATGEFSFEGLEDGDYQLRTTGSKDQYLSFRKSFSIEEQNSRYTELQLVEFQNTRLYGVVSSDKGTPLEEARVNVNYQSGDYWWFESVQTDSDGEWEISGTPEGELSIFISPSEESGRFENFDQTKVDVENGVSEVEFNASLIPYPTGDANVSGTVQLSDGSETFRYLNLRRENYSYFATLDDQTGSFEFNGLPEGIYSVSSYSNSDYFRYFEDIVVQGDTDLNITLLEKASNSVDVSGTVLDQNGDPVVDMSVYARMDGSTNRFFGSDETDSSGNYSISGVPSSDVGGRLSLYVSTGSYGTFGYKYTSPTYLDSWDSETTQDFQLENLGAGDIDMTLVIIDEDGNPIDSAALWTDYEYYDSISGRDQPASREDGSDSDGKVVFSGMNAGKDYRIYINASGFIRATINVNPNEGDGSFTKRVVLKTLPTGSSFVSGRVLTPEGDPIRDANIYLNSSDLGESYRSKSDSNGSFEIRDLPESDYRLSVSSNLRSNGRSVFQYFYTRLSLDGVSGEESFNVTLDRVPTGNSSISGQLLVDGQTLGASDFRVSVYSPSDTTGQIGDQVRVGIDGRWSIENLPSGEYRVEYYVSVGNSKYSYPDSKFVTVQEDQNLQLDSQTAKKLSSTDSSLTVSVKDLDSHYPISDASVNIYMQDSNLDSVNADTDENGRVTFSNIPAGEYSVWVNKNGYLSPVGQSRTVEVSGNSAIRLSLEDLNANGEITGVVEDEFGNPISGAYVYSEVTNSETRETRFFSYAESRTNSSGEYVLKDVPIGVKINVVVNADGLGENNTSYAEARKSVLIEDDGTPSAVKDFSLFEGSKIIGSIEVEGGIRADNLSVEARSKSDQRWLGSGSTDASGAFEISGLPNEDVNLVVRDFSRFRDFRVVQGFVNRTANKSAEVKPVLADANGVTGIGVGTTKDIGTITVSLGGEINGHVELETSDGKTRSFMRSADVEIYREVSGIYVKLDETLNSYASGWSGGNFNVRGLETGNYKLRFVDRYSPNRPFNTVFNGGAETLADADPISVTAEQATTIEPVGLVIPQPQTEATSVDLSTLSEQEREQKRDTISAEPSSDGATVDMGSEMAGEWVSVSSEDQSNPARNFSGYRMLSGFRTLSTSSTQWYQVGSDGEVSLEGLKEGQVVSVADSNSELVGWTTVQSEPENNSGSVGISVATIQGFDKEFYSPGDEVTVTGNKLGSLQTVTFGDQVLEIKKASDSQASFTIPSGLAQGEYLIDFNFVSYSIEYANPLKISGESVAATGECDFHAWTKRISNNQAKVYIKCPEIGVKYRILHQTAGQGPYESILAKTLTDSEDEVQVFNEFGRYIVRTINLEDINRIRIRSGDEELRKVRYNR